MYMNADSIKLDEDFSYPDFSIVIECQTFLQTDETWHARKMLQQLCKQLVEISPKMSSKVELIIVHDPVEIDASKIEKFAKEQLINCSSMIELKIIPGPGLHYYEMKNLGSKHCSNDLILFTDTDVIPDEGWIVGFLESFKMSKISVVGGNSYVSLNSLLEKSLALIWFTPPLNEKIYEKPDFWANNVAFSRKIFESHPFPFLPQFHGQCTALVNELLSNNIKIFCQPRCKVTHPMPTTVREFVTWAFSQGLDFVAKRRLVKIKIKQENGIEEKRGSIQQIFSRTRKRFRYVGFSPKVAIVAPGILLTYFFIMSIGIIVSAIFPNYYPIIRKRKWRFWT